jgi:septal ring factor EnvC (AmiA/AmiB activator)
MESSQGASVNLRMAFTFYHLRSSEQLEALDYLNKSNNDLILQLRKLQEEQNALNQSAASQKKQVGALISWLEEQKKREEQKEK